MEKKYVGFRATEEDLKKLNELKVFFENPLMKVRTVDLMRFALNELHEKYVVKGGK